MSVARSENSSSVSGSGSSTPSASLYMSTRRMLWTLSSGALRRGAGQLSMTRFPRCTPESSSVLRQMRAVLHTDGGRRLMRYGLALILNFYLLPFDFRLHLEDVAAEVLVF